MERLTEEQKRERRAECQLHHHRWDYNSSHPGSSTYYCIDCPAILTEIEDCPGG